MKKFVVILLMLLLPFNVKAISISATSSILMDMDSNRILYSDNIHNIRSVASISKIMTAILAIESNKLEDVVTIGEEIKEAYGSGIYIQIDEQMKLKDLVYGLMLRSGNDAALAIAKYVSGDVSKFVELMNVKAKEIGMKNTSFNNPSGLDQEKGNYSTAYDMAILTSYANKNEIYKEITKTKNYKVKTNVNFYSWINKNKMLYLYKFSTGGKTGFTEIARRTLVSTATKENLNLVAVTLNDGNDFNDHKNMLEYGFKNYKSYKILSKGNINILNETYYIGSTFYIKEDYKYPLSKNEINNIILKFEIERKTKVNDNEKIGVVNVYIGDNKIYSQDVFIKLEQIQKKSFIQKILDYFK